MDIIRVMGRHRPSAKARREADGAAKRIGREIETARRSVTFSIEAIAHQARVAPSTVVRVLHGDGGAHLDTVYAVAAAVGLRPSIKLYPTELPGGLRDTGQLHIAQFLIGVADPVLVPRMELPVGDPFGRAADLVFFGPNEIVMYEIERSLFDFQASKRAAMLKRDALQARHRRPVRLVIAVEDTRRNRELAAPYAPALASDLPASSGTIMRHLRSGEELGQDGLLWVRPWRKLPSPMGSR